MEKNKLEAALETSKKSSAGKMSSDASQNMSKDSSSISEVSQSFVALFTS